MALVCSNCGTENPAGTTFCIECATRLAVACPVCGRANPPAAKFCGACATPLVAGAAASAPTTPRAGPSIAVTPAVAERRVVSVLFADLVGFTTLAEGRDAEETRELLSGYFDLARDVISRYGGTVEKFIGDAVMAVWGAPVAQEDDAERAVRAALELVDAVRALGPSIQARGGVLTGEAAVNLGATNQGMVAGDLVNTASRLQSVATPGTVLVGEATHRAASRAIVFEPAGQQTLKGKSTPVPAWRALRVVAERGGRNRSESLEAPFVGRDDELRLLKDLFHATTRERRARLVSVIGPAGIGKTRLAWEFLKYIDGLVETVWWHDGRSPAYGEGISFWALGEMVRERAKLLETDDEGTTRAKIAAALATHVPDTEERRWIEPALLALLGIDAGGRSEQLFAAWRTFFERLAASAPVVMVFEDFQFADTGLLDFVDHLLEWSRNVPIYVVTLSRPELLEKRSDWGAGKRNFTSVYVEPLPEGAMRELLAGLVPGLPVQAAKAIVDRAGGVPLYAVETVRMLLAEGRLALEDGAYHPVGDLANLAVPETLTALIASRLDSLAPDERALVSDAAVLGQSFTPAGLSAIAGLSESDLEPRLRVLVRRELLTVEADPRSPERGQYAFVQALIREVAYNTLAKRDRKTRHLAAARFFESLGSDELAGALAGHYLDAHENAAEGPEAEALAAQARIALGAATARAVALGGHEQAVAFIEQALTVTDDESEKAELMLRAARSALAALRYDEAERYFEAAIDLHRARGDADAAARATAGLGHVLLHRGRVEEAIALLEPALAGLGDDREDAPAAVMMGALARAYRMHDEPARAIEWAERVLPIAERLDLVDEVAAGLLSRAGGLVGWRPREASALVRAALELAVAHDLVEVETRARTILTFTQVTDDPRAGLASARAGLDNALRLGSRFYAMLMIGNGADCAFRTGDWDWATAILGEWLDGDLEPNARIELTTDLARFLACQGEDASALLADIEPLIAGVSDRQFAAYRSLSVAWGALSAGRFDATEDAVRRATNDSSIFDAVGYPLAARAAIWSHNLERARSALSDLDRSGHRGVAIDCDRIVIRAGIAALDGSTNEAFGLYRDALRRWRDAGLAWDEALCAIDMATFLLPAEPEVAAAIASAREILSQLGARPFLDRLNAVSERRASPPDAEFARSRDTSSV